MSFFGGRESKNRDGIETREIEQSRDIGAWMGLFSLVFLALGLGATFLRVRNPEGSLLFYASKATILGGVLLLQGLLFHFAPAFSCRHFCHRQAQPKTAVGWIVFAASLLLGFALYFGARKLFRPF